MWDSRVIKLAMSWVPFQFTRYHKVAIFNLFHFTTCWQSAKTVKKKSDFWHTVLLVGNSHSSMALLRIEPPQNSCSSPEDNYAEAHESTIAASRSHFKGGRKQPLKLKWNEICYFSFKMKTHGKWLHPGTFIGLIITSVFYSWRLMSAIPILAKTMVISRWVNGVIRVIRCYKWKRGQGFPKI